MVRPVSVLMAVWNTPLAELERSINSITNQTFGDFEFLIIDDGSTHQAVPQYLESRARDDRRIQIVRKPHRGLTASLNRGIARAQGDWIARQDADDWSEPERLARQLTFLKHYPSVIVCGTNAWTHQQDGNVLWSTRFPQSPSEIRAALPHGNPFFHGSAIFHRKTALALGGYRESFKCSQDYDFFWRLADHGEPANLPEPLYHYRYSAGSVSADRAAEQNIACRAAKILADARQAGRAEDVKTALDWARRTYNNEFERVRAMLKQADHLMLAGYYRRAYREYCRLLRNHPASPLAWAKLTRLGVFVAAPGFRQACFR
jgi:glycosyltransferase involved in cell wall biosynthesis